MEIAKSFTNYTTAEGLANDNVYSIAADKDGYIWFGTGGGGVSRFDNKKAKALHNLLEDKKNFQNRLSEKARRSFIMKEAGIVILNFHVQRIEPLAAYYV